MMRKPSLLVTAIVLALAQIGFLSWMIVARASVLRSGQQVLLKVEPVDPRDLFRGDYVRLSYEISQLPAALIGDIPPGSTVSDAVPIYVRLQKQDDGFWRATSARLQKPEAAVDDSVDLRGRMFAGQVLQGEAFVHVDFGIERFYLPEGAGKPIEQDMRVRSFGILAAVPPSGQAQIKGLIDEGKSLFEEQLY